jgi:hypothetical protein
MEGECNVVKETHYVDKHFFQFNVFGHVSLGQKSFRERESKVKIFILQRHNLLPFEKDKNFGKIGV